MNHQKELKNIKIVMYSDAILSLEIFFAPVMVAFYLKYIGLSFEEMSIFFSILLFFNIIFEIPSGAISDFIGRKKAFLIGQSIYLLAMISLLFVKEMEVLLVTAFLFSFGGSLSSGNLSSIIFRNLKILNKEESYFFKIDSKAMAISLISSGIASILGGYFGMVDLKIPLLIDIVILGISIVVIKIFLSELEINVNKNMDLSLKKSFAKFKQIILLGFRLSVKSKEILFILIFSSLIFSLLRTSFNFYQPMFEDVNVNLDVFGYILFVFNLIASFSAYMFSKIKKVNNNFFVFITVGLLLLSILFLINSQSAISIFIVFLIHQIIRGYYSSYSLYYLNCQIPTRHKSRTTIQSFQNFFNALFCAFMIYMSGIIERKYEFINTILIISFCTVILIFISVIILKRNSKQNT